MKKRYKNIFEKERRDFLKILASAGITKQLLRASPLIWGAMYARLAEAQTTVNKCAIVYIPNGCMPARWLPNSSLSNLSSLAMSAPYNGVKSQCHFLRNMSHHRGGHGVMDTVINNSWGGDSFEVNIGRTVGANLPFMYVNLGCMNGGYGITRNGDSGQLVPPESSPYNAFKRLFSGTSSSTSSTGGGTNPKQYIVDSHKAAISALRTKLGTYEKARLDSHLNAISAFEARLAPSSSSTTTSSGGSCAPGTAPSQYALTNDTFQTQAQDMANIIALALQCNLTAACSLVLGNESGQFAMPYLSYGGIYHQSIHCCGGGPEFDVTRGHLSAQSANVIQQLINKNVINNTIFMEVTDMGDGNAHTSTDIPLIMAGAGGRISRGVSTAGGSSYTPLNMLATAGAILNAGQHSGYTYGNVSVFPGV